LPGDDPETRASATGCPGVAASSPILRLLFGAGSRAGPLATAAVVSS